jgi:hypothetical protein
MTRTVIVQARRTREAASRQALEFQHGFARESCIPATMFKSYAQHFIDARHAMALESGV